MDCLDCFTSCIFIAVTILYYIHPCVHQMNFFVGVIKLNVKVHLQRFGRCLEHPCSHVGNFAAPLKMFVLWSAWGHTNGSCWGKCKHYSFAFHIRNFPAGLWIKTTDLLIASAACLTSLQLHCFCSLSLNQDCLRKIYCKIKVDMSRCCSNRKKCHIFYCLYRHFLMPATKTLFPEIKIYPAAGPVIL